MEHKNISFTELIKHDVTINSNIINGIDEFFIFFEINIDYLFDYIIKIACNNLNKSPFFDYKYCLIGNKSLEFYRKISEPLAGFDIYLFDNPDYDNQDLINEFGTNLVDEINSVLKKYHVLKYAIYLKLLNINLIDITLSDDYIFTDLFVYGKSYEINTDKHTYGIFFKLVLKNDIFIYNGNIIEINNLISSVEKRNIIYYPIINIYTNILPNPVEINDICYTHPIDNLLYPKIPYALCFLHYISDILPDVLKIKKECFQNLLLELCSSLDNYNCIITNDNFIDNYVKSKKDAIYNNINYSQYIYNLFIIDTINARKKSCLKNIILIKPKLYTSYTSYTNFTTKSIKSEMEKIYSDLELITLNNDINNALFLNTTNLFQNIKDYLIYSHLGITHSLINDIKPNKENKQLTLLNGTTIYIEYTIPDNILDIIIQMEKSFLNIRGDLTIPDKYESFLGNIQDTFKLYRLQSFILFDNGIIYNFSNAKVDDILYIPYYMSTSFNNSYGYEKFYNFSSVIFIINIKKTSKKWIFLNKYSNYPNEYEILLDKKFFLKITDVNKSTIDINNTLTEITTINLDLYDTLDELNIYSNVINNKYENENKNNKKIVLYNFTNKDINIIKSKININNIKFVNFIEINMTDLLESSNKLSFYEKYFEYIYKISSYIPSLLENIEKLKYNKTQIIKKEYPFISLSNLIENADKYKQKYLKYKKKYLNLKNN